MKVTIVITISLVIGVLGITPCFGQLSGLYQPAQTTDKGKISLGEYDQLWILTVGENMIGRFAQIRYGFTPFWDLGIKLGAMTDFQAPIWGMDTKVRFIKRPLNLALNIEAEIPRENVGEETFPYLFKSSLIVDKYGQQKKWALYCGISFTYWQHADGYYETELGFTLGGIRAVSEWLNLLLELQLAETEHPGIAIGFTVTP